MGQGAYLSTALAIRIVVQEVGQAVVGVVVAAEVGVRRSCLGYLRLKPEPGTYGPLASTPNFSSSPSGCKAKASRQMALCEEEAEERTCRLCWGDEDDGPLVQPCACRGSVKLIHKHCLVARA